MRLSQALTSLGPHWRQYMEELKKEAQSLRSELATLGQEEARSEAAGAKGPLTLGEDPATRARRVAPEAQAAPTNGPRSAACAAGSLTVAPGARLRPPQR